MNRPWWRILAVGGWAVVMGAAAWVYAHSTGKQAVLAFPMEVASDEDGNLPSRAGPPIPAGTRRTVPAGQSLVLSLVPGITAQLDAGTDFSVDELTVRQTGTVVEERRARLTIHEGKSFFAVALPPDRQVSLTVATPAGIAESQPGTVFSVTVTGNGSRVVCAWGGVRWQEENGGPRKSLVLLAGEFREGAPSSPESSVTNKAAEVPALQEELAELLRFSPRVNALQSRRRGEISFQTIKGR